MPNYCKRCQLCFEESFCPRCGRKKSREVRDDDLCFLTEREWMWGEMLLDVLKQNNIKFLTENVLGAGLALKTGPMRERIRVYVLYSQLSRAKEIMEELFAASEDDQ